MSSIVILLCIILNSLNIVLTAGQYQYFALHPYFSYNFWDHSVITLFPFLSLFSLQSFLCPHCDPSFSNSWPPFSIIVSCVCSKQIHTTWLIYIMLILCICFQSCLFGIGKPGGVLFLGEECFSFFRHFLVASRFFFNRVISFPPSC